VEAVVEAVAEVGFVATVEDVAEAASEDVILKYGFRGLCFEYLRATVDDSRRFHRVQFHQLPMYYVLYLVYYFTKKLYFTLFLKIYDDLFTK
jgi:hypothetical protein